MEKYEIGNYIFSSEEEYLAGLRDFAKIRGIMKNADVEDPAEALLVYHAVRDQKITFETVVGSRFTDYLIDRFVTSPKELYKRKKKSRPFAAILRKVKSVITACCVLTVFFGIGYYLFYEITEYQSRQALAVLSETVARDAELQRLSEKELESGQSGSLNKEPGDVISGLERAGSGPPEVMLKYHNVYLSNPDLAGWIKIDDTIIDYPVMHTPEDEEYYLHRNFQKKDDMNGLPFLNAGADPVNPSTNMIIYGHHMKTGEMFGKLQEYKNKNYWSKHRIIHFDTIYEMGEYEVMAVFPSRVYKDNENVFKYYQFTEASTEEEFQYFISNIKMLSLYDTGVEAEYGDTFITLSTCDYEEEDGRFVVVARRIR